MSPVVVAALVVPYVLAVALCWLRPFVLQYVEGGLFHIKDVDNNLGDISVWRCGTCFVGCPGVAFSSILLFRSDSSVNIGGEIYPGSPRWCVGKSRLPGGICNLILFSPQLKVSTNCPLAERKRLSFKG